MTDIKTTDSTKNAPQANLFFFYGSLRTGYWNNRYLSKKSKKMGDAVTVEPFALYIGKQGSVPTCVPAKDGPSLHGELWNLDGGDTGRIYALEAGYLNKSIEVVTEDGEIHRAIIFHHSSPETCQYMRGGFELIPSGDYTKALSTDGERLQA